MIAPGESDPRPPVLVSVMITRRCNMACAHCSVRSGPTVRQEPDEQTVRRRVDEAIAAGVSSVVLTGGEPMLRRDLVFELLERCRRSGVRSSVTTNGTWGRSRRVARETMRRFDALGLSRLTVSYDRYHADFAGPEALRNVAELAADCGFPVDVNVIREETDDEVAELIADAEGKRNVRVRFYDLQPVGRATEELESAAYRSDTDGHCSACLNPAVTDDGRVLACNGPSYFQKAGSPLIVGSLDRAPMAELFRLHQSDAILDVIRTRGPEGLRHELEQTPYGGSFPFRQRYRGLCDLCLHLNSDPEAVAALRQRVEEPGRRAEALALRRLLRAERAGNRSRDAVNRQGAARLYLELFRAGSAREPEPAELAAIFGRADLDWSHHSRLLPACGLARLLEPHLPRLARWAPDFFVERIRRAAMAEALRELVQRAALDSLAEAAADEGVEGIVLKGGALLEPWADGPERIRPRATGDLDVLFADGAAVAIRRRLLEDGFDETVRQARTASHHLAPLTFRGVEIELHERIAPATWSLPERAMTEASVPLRRWAPLRRLDPAGYLVHALVHTSGHAFSHGLKAAWDLRWALDHCDAEATARAARWGEEMGAPRAFAIPLRLLGPELGLELPESLRPPRLDGFLESRLLLVARARILQEIEDPFDLDPWIQHALFLAMQPGLGRRLRHTALLLAPNARRARRAAARRRDREERSRRGLGGTARVWALHWRRYRRARQRAGL